MRPELPPGYVAQPAAHHDLDDGACYELVRVYDPVGRLDEDLSHYLVMHRHGEMPHVNALTFRELREELGRHAVSWSSFAEQTFDPHRVDDWFRKVRSQRQRRAPRAYSTYAAAT